MEPHVKGPASRERNLRTDSDGGGEYESAARAVLSISYDSMQVRQCSTGKSSMKLPAVFNW